MMEMREERVEWGERGGGKRALECPSCGLKMGAVACPRPGGRSEGGDVGYGIRLGLSLRVCIRRELTSAEPWGTAERQLMEKGL